MSQHFSVCRGVRYFIFSILILASMRGWSSSQSFEWSAFERPEAQKGKTEFETKGDDLFPWPAGSEITFPWDTVTGRYVVRTNTSSIYAGHSLAIWVTYVGPQSRRMINIYHFDRRGVLFAQGKGFADRNRKFVTAHMTTEEDKLEYYTQVRAYERVAVVRGEADSKGGIATVVTFCPQKGKKCKEYSSYLLDRTQ
jgi:hypothetical protein